MPLHQRTPFRIQMWRRHWNRRRREGEGASLRMSKRLYPRHWVHDLSSSALSFWLERLSHWGRPGWGHHRTGPGLECEVPSAHFGCLIAASGIPMSPMDHFPSVLLSGRSPCYLNEWSSFWFWKRKSLTIFHIITAQSYHSCHQFILNRRNSISWWEPGTGLFCTERKAGTVGGWWYWYYQVTSVTGAWEVGLPELSSSLATVLFVCRVDAFRWLLKGPWDLMFVFFSGAPSQFFLFFFVC